MFQSLPPITKNLLLINILFFAAKYLAAAFDINLDVLLGAFFPLSSNFHAHQIFTHFFMHADFFHILFNMYGVFMFGSILENTLGGKKYLKLYIIAGLGAFALYNLVHFIEFYQAAQLLHSHGISFDSLNEYAKHSYLYSESVPPKQKFLEFLDQQQNLKALVFADPLAKIFSLYYSPMLGASGALFGLLVAFAVIYPDMRLMLIFIPVPIKAKYLIGVYILLELYLAIQNNPNDNIAHFAHLGGALFGYFFARSWLKNYRRWY